MTKPINPNLGLAALLSMALACGSAFGAAPKKPAKSASRPSTAKPAAKAKAAAKPAPPAPEPAAGTLKAPYDEFTVLLAPWNGSKMVVAAGKDGAARVPPGNYFLTSWNVKRKDASGRVWRAEGGPQGQPHMVLRVANGTASEVRLATPLRVALTVEQVDGQFGFILRFDGTVGDRCSRVLVDGEPTPAPKLKIMDADGALVETLELKWGCGFLCRKIWTAPEGVKWPLKAVAEVDFGPFPTVGEPVELNREAKNAVEPRMNADERG